MDSCRDWTDFMILALGSFRECYERMPLRRPGGFVVASLHYSVPSVTEVSPNTEGCSALQPFCHRLLARVFRQASTAPAADAPAGPFFKLTRPSTLPKLWTLGN